MENDKSDKTIFKCSFCGSDKNQNIVGRGDTYICHDCFLQVKQLFECFDQPEFDEYEEIYSTCPSSKNIYEIFSKAVIGQYKAKRRLAVAVHNHLLRLTEQTETIKKSNVLMLGPSGCGKTLLAKTLANALKVPFVIADATSYTESGYTGDDVEKILTRLLMNAGGNIRAAEHGIVYIDEIDKIARKQGSMNARDPAGEGVQQALLKMIEGCTMTVPLSLGHRQMGMQYIQFNTDNVLFICGGAFEGLHDNERYDNRPIGFVETDLMEETEEVEPIYEDLIEFGILPELLGRLPVVVELDELSKKELVQIMTEPEDSLVEEYTELLKADGVDIVFRDDALSEIADEALRRGVGARGLRSIMEEILLDIMFNSYEYRGVVIITRDYILERLCEEREPYKEPDLETLCFV